MGYSLFICFSLQIFSFFLSADVVSLTSQGFQILPVQIPYFSKIPHFSSSRFLTFQNFHTFPVSVSFFRRHHFLLISLFHNITLPQFPHAAIPGLSILFQILPVSSFSNVILLSRGSSKFFQFKVPYFPKLPHFPASGSFFTVCSFPLCILLAAELITIDFSLFRLQSSRSADNRSMGPACFLFSFLKRSDTFPFSDRPLLSDRPLHLLTPPLTKC